MSESERIASLAGDRLLQTIETLRQLCRVRRNEKLSTAKYIRLTQELEDMSRLLAIYNGTAVDKWARGERAHRIIDTRSTSGQHETDSLSTKI
ncbi:MAG: hypothetical protein LUE10_03835 [Alistipes sp.]|nr:hypothetical protein [Alistipes sp.]